MRTLIAVFCLMLLVGPPSLAADDDFSRKTLTGIAGVKVIVEPPDKDGKSIGLTTEKLQNMIELSLRKARIHIPTNDEYAADEAKPFIYVNVNLQKNGRVYAYHIDIELVQTVVLVTDRNKVAAGTTWSIGAVGMGNINDPEPVKRTTLELLDMFINAYLAANPNK